jgi:hypothetical protein
MVVVENHDRRKIRSMLLGHAPNHAPDVFRSLNLETKHVITSRNVIWLDKMYGDWKRLEQKDIDM